ncbi:MAG: cobalamin-dependent protein [Candidatus Latescibacteria bacterium]|nr:cobalamin-dependent protein [Candidatus Latescibacterota bacterium]
MKVYFLNPSGDYPNGYPPLGLLYLVSICKKYGHSVYFYDLAAKNSDIGKFENELESICPDILCVSVYTTGLNNTMKLLAEIKNKYPKLKIIVGGPHVSALPESLIEKYNAIDYEVIGEGEKTIIELLESIKNGTPAVLVKGISYRSVSGIIRTGNRERITNLDTIPFPAVDVIRRFKYGYDKISVGKRVGLIITSRGCPYNCTFCHKGTFGNKYTRRSPVNVIEEVIHQYCLLEVDEFYFVDDLFVTDEKWMIEFIERYNKTGLGLPWKCLGRVDHGSESLYRKMKEAGCFLIQFGVETGNEQIMKNIRKNIRFDQVEESINICKKAGINSATFFTIGHEGENEKTALDTIRFAQKLNADVCHFFTVSPYPGTANYNLLSEKEKIDWDKISYYHTKDRLPISISNLSPLQILQYQKNARFEFYGRLKFLLNIINSRGPIKITMIKLAIFTVSMAYKIYLGVTMKRVVPIFEIPRLKNIEPAIVIFSLVFLMIILGFAKMFYSLCVVPYGY